MGSYVNLLVNDHLIHISKSYVNNEVMTLFSNSDKSPDASYKYITTVENAIHRLEIMGYTLERTKKDFKSNQKILIERLEEFTGDYEKDIELLKTSEFDSFIKAFIKLKKNGLQYWSDRKDIKKYNLSPITLFLLEEDHLINDIISDGRLLNYPSPNIRLFLRAYLESCNKDESIILDLSDVVSAGYYKKDDDIKDISSSRLIGEYDKNSKIIILTEGSSDKTMIESSLRLLYPHLVDYYAFMEFNEYKTKGGASSLVEQVKAFSGAGIRNKIIAIFDNDTAAFDARRALVKINLPKNISICNYPNIPIAEKYPTLGQSGKELINVNGLASSIEMYLGKDILEQKGELTPVQWKGYNESLSKYHGELLFKKEIQNRFYEKLKDCKKDPKNISNYDWSGMKLILSSIFDKSRFRE